MTYTCKHCGKKVEALTICGCDRAQNEFYPGESTRLATNDTMKRAWYAVENPLFLIRGANHSGSIELASKDEIRAGLRYLEGENERLTAELENEKAEYANLYQSTAEYQRELTAELAAVRAELAECRAVIAKIDIAAPLADETCLEPGITLSEAVRRQLQEQPQ